MYSVFVVSSMNQLFNCKQIEWAHRKFPSIFVFVNLHQTSEQYFFPHYVSTFFESQKQERTVPSIPIFKILCDCFNCLCFLVAEIFGTPEKGLFLLRKKNMSSFRGNWAFSRFAHIDSCSDIIRTNLLAGGMLPACRDDWTSVEGRLRNHEVTPGGGHGLVGKAGS